MGIGIIVGVIALLLWGGIQITQMVKAARHRKTAKELAVAGDWKGAAANYKKAILQRLDSRQALSVQVRELTDLYKANGVEADLDSILESPGLMKEIWKSRVKDSEKHRLTAELHAKVSSLLDSLP